MGKIIYILIIILFTSCGLSKKTVKSSTSKETEKTEILSDSISKETINKGIDDSATIKIQQSDTGDRDFDLAVNQTVTNILRSINFQKTSGDNSYRAYYDEKLEALQFRVQLGETKNSEVASSNSTLVQKTLTEQFSELIKKTIIPWWIYAIAIFLLRKQIFGFIAFIYPPVRGLKTLKDIVTPPKPPSNATS